jgi:hypothetical protein
MDPSAWASPLGLGVLLAGAGILLAGLGIMSWGFRENNKGGKD